jgi:glucose-1-phosphate thymidylyltransferase
MGKQNLSRADIVLGLFPATNPQKMDMVKLDDVGNVRGIQIKPSQTDLRYTWIIAVWNFSFTQFMHDFVTSHQNKIPSARITSSNVDFDEIYLGDVIQAALDAGIKIDTVIFNQGVYVDIGTPEDMLRAIQSHSSLYT